MKKLDFQLSLNGQILCNCERRVQVLVPRAVGNWAEGHLCYFLLTLEIDVYNKCYFVKGISVGSTKVLVFHLSFLVIPFSFQRKTEALLQISFLSSSKLSPGHLAGLNVNIQLILPTLLCISCQLPSFTDSPHILGGSLTLFIT